VHVCFLCVQRIYISKEDISMWGDNATGFLYVSNISGKRKTAFLHDFFTLCHYNKKRTVYINVCHVSSRHMMCIYPSHHVIISALIRCYYNTTLTAPEMIAWCVSIHHITWSFRHSFDASCHLFDPWLCLVWTHHCLPVGRRLTSFF